MGEKAGTEVGEADGAPVWRVGWRDAILSSFVGAG